MCVWAFQLGPSGTLADYHIVSLATSLRLQGQECPVGGRLAGPDLSQRLAGLDLGVDLIE